MASRISCSTRCCRNPPTRRGPGSTRQNTPGNAGVTSPSLIRRPPFAPLVEPRGGIPDQVAAHPASNGNHPAAATQSARTDGSYRATDEPPIFSTAEARSRSPAAREPAHALVAMGAPRHPCRRHGNASGGRADAQIGPACRCQRKWVPGSGGTFGSSRHPRDSALPHQPQGRKGKSLERETSVTQASLPRSAPHSIGPTHHRRNPLSSSPEEVRDVGHAPHATDIPHTPHPDPNRGRTINDATTRMS